MSFDDDESEIGRGSEPDTNYSIQWSDKFNRPSLAVIRAISSYTNTKPDSLKPLYYNIDLESLDELFQESEKEVHISFHYRDNQIVVGPNRVLIKNNESMGSAL